MDKRVKYKKNVIPTDYVDGTDIVIDGLTSSDYGRGGV